MKNGIWAELVEDLNPVEAAVRKECLLKPDDPFKLAQVELALPDLYLYPALAVLSARLFNYSGPKVLALATAVQFIYLATCVHSKKDPQAGFSILVGDLLYTKFFRYLTRSQSLSFLNPLAMVISQMHEAAVAELTGRQNGNTEKRQDYLICQSYWGLLSREACRLSGRLAGAGEKDTATLAELGYNLGASWGHARQNCLHVSEQYRRRCHELLRLLPQVKEAVLLGRIADSLV